MSGTYFVPTGTFTSPTDAPNVSMPIPSARPKRRGVVFGVILISIGIIILLSSLGAIAPFDVDLSFPLIMFAVAAVVGFRSRFRNPAWIFLALIGLANAIPEFRIGRLESDEVAVAIGFIFLGAYIMRRRRWQSNSDPVRPSWQAPASYGAATAGPAAGATAEDPRTINTFALFSGRKELITSKDFRGGRIQAVFGGIELNLMNADSTASQIVVDVTAALGGVEIVVPSHWELVNDVDAIFGGVNDARTMRTAPGDAPKTLVIRGFCFMGGVEIKGY